MACLCPCLDTPRASRNLSTGREHHESAILRHFSACCQSFDEKAFSCYRAVQYEQLATPGDRSILHKGYLIQGIRGDLLGWLKGVVCFGVIGSVFWVRKSLKRTKRKAETPPKYLTVTAVNRAHKVHRVGTHSLSDNSVKHGEIIGRRQTIILMWEKDAVLIHRVIDNTQSIFLRKSVKLSKGFAWLVWCYCLMMCWANLLHQRIPIYALRILSLCFQHYELVLNKKFLLCYAL